jgi:2-polyprenyl-3-methyl-5-hydroxy-6-metoxy-1,4-benzoquinol methylase
VTVSDYAPEALALCRRNAQANGTAEPRALRLNWRQPPEALFDRAGDGFPVVLAADVLYEERDVDPLLALLGRIVAPDGLLWLAEPRRRVSLLFLARAGAAGWERDTELHHGPWPDPKDADVVVGVHRLRRARP